MRQRRQSSTKVAADVKKPPATNGHAHEGNQHGHGHANRPVPTGRSSHDHDRDHDHGPGLFHVHSHGHDNGAELVIEALKGRGDRGSRITLLGLLANIVLTGAKGAAGWFMNSASLLAEAAHSLSDLLGDFVVLASWSTSRKHPSSDYPYGYGKFETMGTTAVSLLLIAGACGIGFHSYYLLLAALEPVLSTVPAGAVGDVLAPVIGRAHEVASSVDHVLDPNAAWFALAGLLIKEYLFRVTKKVAEDEGSSVLMANAYHHRSDVYSSGVALVAILGTWGGIPVLDPIGGLLVSGVILYQGSSLLLGAFRELTDAGVPAEQRDSLEALLAPLVSTSEPHRLLGIRNVRAVRSGALLFVDLTADVPPDMTMREAHEIEGEIRECLIKERKEIKEVRVHLHAEGIEEQNGHNDPPC